MYVTLAAKPKAGVRRSLSGCMSGCGSNLAAAPVLYARRKHGRIVLRGLGAGGDGEDDGDANVASGSDSSGDDSDSGESSGGGGGGLLNTVIKDGTAIAKAAVGKKSSGNKGKSPGASSGNSASNWLSQQSNTTLAIGGTAAFALLLAIAG